VAERLQKVLARAGLGSRREIEDWIRQGRIAVDGAVAALGQRVEAVSRIELDGRRIRLGVVPARVIAYHKPVGELVSRRDPGGRPTVFQRLPEPVAGRWIAVGRLDINTSGLLLVTTDGHLAHALMHPSSAIEREYRCRVRGRLSGSECRQLLHGIDLDGEPARFGRIDHESGGGGVNQWYRVVLHEGRYREVRRLFEALGHPVSRLIRVRYGPVVLTSTLTEGAWHELDVAELTALEDAVGATGAAGLRRRDRESTDGGR
jgi:23S rRNA pseudouridine2605 synthase